MYCYAMLVFELLFTMYDCFVWMEEICKYKQQKILKIKCSEMDSGGWISGS